MNELIDDVLYIIFKYKPVDIYVIRIISKRFYRLSNSENLWKYYFDDSYQEQVKPNDQHVVSFLIRGMNLNLSFFVIKLLLNVSHLSLTYPMKNLRKLQNISSNIGQLKNLTNLNLSYNILSSLPSEIQYLTNLTQLNLVNNRLTSINFEICFLTKLKELKISSNEIESIPREISRLINLNDLWLHENRITEIPTDLYNLIKLEKLYLDGNNISIVPQGISRLTNLHSLHLYNNNITFLPSDINNLYLEDLRWKLIRCW